MNEVAKTKEQALAKRVAQILDDPFGTLIPVDFQIALTPYWLENRTALGSGLEIAAKVKRWIETKGLTVPELQEAIKNCNDAADHEPQKYTSGVLAQFTTAVIVTIERRRRIEEQMKAREEAKKLSKEVAPVAANFAEVFRMPTFGEE